MHSLLHHARQLLTFVRRLRYALLASVAVALLLLVWLRQPGPRLTWSFENASRLVLSPDGQLVAVVGGPLRGVSNGNTSADVPSSIEFRRLTDGALVRHVDARGAYGIAFSPDGRLFAAGGQDATIRVWRVADGVLLHHFVGHTDAVTRVVFTPDGHLLSQSDDQTIRMWSLTPDGAVRILARTVRGSPMALSADGQTVAAVLDHDTIDVWRVRNGHLLHRLSGAPRVLVFAPGTHVLTGLIDTTTPRDKPNYTRGSIVRWQLPQQVDPTPAFAVRPSTHGLVYRGDGAQLAVVVGKPRRNRGQSIMERPLNMLDEMLDGMRSANRTIQIFDVGTERRVATIPTPYTSIGSMRYTADGRELVFITSDDTVSIWPVPR